MPSTCLPLLGGLVAGGLVAGGHGLVAGGLVAGGLVAIISSSESHIQYK